MLIGIPKEIKIQEARVALTPAACADLVKSGHRVLIQHTAGEYSGYPDQEYVRAGGEIADNAEQIYEHAELVVKVKEPQPAEVSKLQSGQRLFSFLHLAAEPSLLQALVNSGVTAIGFETVQERQQLPLLAPMSDIAGRIAIQLGANLLYHYQGGRGVLLGGLPAAERGNVVILGAGVAGSSAVIMAQGMGANVTVFDLNRDKLEKMRTIGANVTALHANEHTIEEYTRNADLLVGAVLIPGAKTPHLVNESMVKTMRKGSVVIDISIDQGGCIETIHPTSYAEPTYVLHEVVHCGITNLPGAVPRSASQALSASLLPYILRLAKADWKDDEVLCSAINVDAGQVVHPALLFNE